MALAETSRAEPSQLTTVGPAPPSDEAPRAPTRHPRAWHGMRAEVLELYGPRPYIGDLRCDRPRLLAILEEVGGLLETRDAPHRPASPRRRGAHRLAFIPAGRPAWTFAEHFRYIRLVVIDFDVQALIERCGLAPATELEPALVFDDDAVSALAALIACDCVEPGSAHPIYGDSLALVLFHHLVHRQARELNADTPRRLPERQLQRVLAHMEKFNAVQLEELAALLGLSRSYFGRVFKASTGMAPHRWLVNARVQRAQQCLLDSEASLVEVALASGFSDQSHLTRAFRRVTGQTPGAWRRDHEP